MKKYSETPSLGKNQEWKSKSGPSPFRDQITGGVAFPPRRSLQERALKWHDVVTNAWRVAVGPRKAPKVPR
jgi:hypothetical protein